MALSAQLDKNGNLITKIDEGEEISSNILNTGIVQSKNFSELGVTDGLVAYYPLNGNAFDYVNRNDGTVNGATIAEGMNGKSCYQFNSSHISFPTTIPSTGNFSVSLWGLTTGNQNQCFICTRTAIGEGFSIFILNTRNLRFDTNSSRHWTPGYTMPLNTWEHIVVTRSDSKKQLFVNGELYGQTTSVNPTALSLGTIQTIGMSQANNSAHGNYLQGKIQNIRIYNKALTEREVNIIYDLEKEDFTQMKIGTDSVYISGEFDETH